MKGVRYVKSKLFVNQGPISFEKEFILKTDDKTAFLIFIYIYFSFIYIFSFNSELLDY